MRVVLIGLVNGTSNVGSLDAMAQFVDIAAFALDTVPYFEYVESHSNWADEISSEWLSGCWARDNGFQLDRCTFVPKLQCLPVAALAAVFLFF